MAKFMEFRYFRYCILVIILVVIFTAVYADRAGKKQDAIWLADYQAYQDALRAIEDEDYKEASLILDEFKEKYDSATIYWTLGLTNSLEGNYDEAEKNYAKVQELYPSIVLNTHFLKEYSLILYKSGDDSKAIRYFEKYNQEIEDSGEKSWAKGYIKRINDRINKEQEIL